MKHNPLIISIPHPCIEDWEAMTPDGQGRFCAHCQTRVVDFSNWSDEQLYKYFAFQNSAVCGNFNEAQLNRKIQIQVQPKSKLYRMALALGLSFVVAGSSPSTATPRPPLISENTVLQELSKTLEDSTASFSGKIADDRNEPLMNASIALEKNGKIIGGALSDFDGNFKIDNLLPGVYELKISYAGFQGINETIELKEGTYNKSFSLKRDMGPKLKPTIIKSVKGKNLLVKQPAKTNHKKSEKH